MADGGTAIARGQRKSNQIGVTVLNLHWFCHCCPSRSSCLSMAWYVATLRAYRGPCRHAALPHQAVPAAAGAESKRRRASGGGVTTQTPKPWG